MITEGILNINKAQNMTSHDVVAICRRVLGIKKIGHTGTLDPMATGVLPICIGKSTRVIEYLDMDIKKYRCTMVLGMQTDTQDIWGTVLSTSDVNVTEEEVRDAFSKFIGVIDQKPPMYSAIKVNGKRLYEYAREGIEVDVKTRKIFIKSLEIENINLEAEEKSVTFSVECTKGTYIRTICQDVGIALSCNACMTALERTGSGIFTIDDAIDIEKLKEMKPEEVEKLLYSTDQVLDKFGTVSLDEGASVDFLNGKEISGDRVNFEDDPLYAGKDFYLPVRDEIRNAYNVYGKIFGERKFLGVAFYNKTKASLKADKVFFVRG